MSLERMWAGWRAAYVTEEAEVTGATGDLFERLAAADPDEALVVARDDVAFAVMNAFPYSCGHCMVAPLRRVAELEELHDAELTSLMAMVRDATVAVKAAFHPEGINVGVNLGRAAGAGVPGHLHVHVLPRWSADTNFMTTVAETRVMPEDLRTSYEKLRAAWPSR
ncbi:MAG: HIT domain-containing protein [Acidimicrobiia bacterium]|nr:HIT domain-containing protein [Acidimicrobiia bacterium]